MVRHVVMFKFLPEAEGRTALENAEHGKMMLEKLQGVVPTLKRSEVHINAPEACRDNCELVLIADFDGFDELNEYIVHPEHKKVGEFMKKVRESRSCVDFVI